MVYPLHPPNRKTSIFQNFKTVIQKSYTYSTYSFKIKRKKSTSLHLPQHKGALWAVFHAVFPHCFVSTAVGVEYTSPLHLQGEAPEHTQEWPEKSWIIFQSDLKKAWPTWRPTNTPWPTKTHRPWSMTSHDAPFRPSPVSVALLPTTQRVGTAHRCGGPKIPAISSMMRHRLCGAVLERGIKKQLHFVGVLSNSSKRRSFWFRAQAMAPPSCWACATPRADWGSGHPPPHAKTMLF